jgi:hypothetical protein
VKGQPAPRIVIARSAAKKQSAPPRADAWIASRSLSSGAHSRGPLAQSKLDVFADKTERETSMDSRALFGLSILLSFLASARVAQLYVWPRLPDLPREEALNALVTPHMFRFVGLSFLLPDAVSPALPHSFALHAAYGDLAATILAMITTLALSARASWAIPLAWLLSIVGSVDLLYAYYDGVFGVGLAPGVMGAAVYIPIVVVPPLLIAHAMMFRLLLRGENP